MTIVEKYKGKMIKKVSNTGVPKEEYNALTNQVGELNNQVNNLNNNLANKEEEINNGKEIIANAIGEPLNSEDTFSAMSADINSLLSQFKTNMMNNGITVESSDKFKQLIDKIATMVEEGSGKGIQFASGSVTGSINVAADVYSGTTRLNTPIGFTPTFVFIKATSTAGVNYTEGYKNYFISNLSPVTLTPEYNQGTITLTITGISSNSINLKYERNSASNSGNVIISDWYAIGIGEEDTTLRDSLASILENKGVDVTEEDDMATLIEYINKCSFDADVVNMGGNTVNLKSSTTGKYIFNHSIGHTNYKFNYDITGSYSYTTDTTKYASVPFEGNLGMSDITKTLTHTKSFNMWASDNYGSLDTTITITKYNDKVEFDFTIKNNSKNVVINALEYVISSSIIIYMK